MRVVTLISSVEARCGMVKLNDVHFKIMCSESVFTTILLNQNSSHGMETHEELLTFFQLESKQQILLQSINRAYLLYQ